jgi:hypothetical protein
MAYNFSLCILKNHKKKEREKEEGRWRELDEKEGLE